MAQLDMFVAHEPPPAVSADPDPDRVRRKLAALLAEAREAGARDLPQGRRRLMQTLVPQMTRWLPREEAEEIRQAFATLLAA